jgi:hypothetical protein
VRINVKHLHEYTHSQKNESFNSSRLVCLSYPSVSLSLPICLCTPKFPSACSRNNEKEKKNSAPDQSSIRASISPREIGIKRPSLSPLSCRSLCVSLSHSPSVRLSPVALFLEIKTKTNHSNKNKYTLLRSFRMKKKSQCAFMKNLSWKKKEIEARKKKCKMQKKNQRSVS